MPNVEAVYSRRFMLISRREHGAITAFVLRGVNATWGQLRQSVTPGDPRRG